MPTDEGSRTDEIPTPFKLPADIKLNISEMVPLAGIEPARP